MLLLSAPTDSQAEESKVEGQCIERIAELQESVHDLMNLLEEKGYKEGQSVVVDFGDPTLEKLDTRAPSSIPHCCDSEINNIACHAYNCGDSTRGCYKFCAEN